MDFMNRAFSRAQRGTTLFEMLAVVAVIGLAAVAVGKYSVGRFETREGHRAACEILSNMKLARFQAVTRSRPCRFVLDTSGRTIRVVDLNDPAVSTDDILLGEASLGGNVDFSHPLGSAPVTLKPISGTTWQSTFAADGSVTEGTGDVTIGWAGDWYRVSLFGAGGTRISRWNGASWLTGS